MPHSAENQPVFYDPKGGRRRHVRRTLWVFAATITSLAAILIVSVLINPLLPQLDLRPIPSLPRPADTRFEPPPLIVKPLKQRARRAEVALREALTTTRVVPGKRPSQMHVTPPPKNVPQRQIGSPSKPLSVAFYVNWDDASYQSLKRNLNRLDWVIPEWLRLGEGNDPLIREIDPRALDFIRRERAQTRIVPLIQNTIDEKWNANVLANALRDRLARKHLIDALVQFIDQNAFSGLCIDFEEVPIAIHARLLRFLQELKPVFQARGWIVAQALPFNDPDWDYRGYARSVDFLLLMAYDQHWATSSPGSIAAQDWFEQLLDTRMQALRPEKTIIAVGAYGYNWTAGEEARDISFQDAMLTARDSNAHIQFDPVTSNPHFTYEEGGQTHTVWFLDGVTVYNQIRIASDYQPAGFALWRLGSEDRSIWSIFDPTGTNRSPDGLRRMKYGYDVDFEGEGEILQVVSRPQEGSREIKIDQQTGLIQSEEYTALPSSFVVRRSGNRPGWIALTFDDGPDPIWTVDVLRILKRSQIPATFFIIGKNGQLYPDLVRQVISEGHEIGNHTFTHPNLGEIPGRIIDLELNATQRLIESLTGRSTRLFRPPYFGDVEPSTPDQVRALVRAQRLGYLTIGLRIDPHDWALPAPDEIVRRIIQGATNADPDQRGQVILLHDGGGDRERTVEALPRVIYELKRRGFVFVSISQLAGLTRDQAMRLLPAGEQGFFTRVNAITFYTLSLTGWLLQWLFFIGILFGLVRMGFIGALAFAQFYRAKKRAATQAADTYQPFVSVIIPAFNEERVIARTLESLLASSYPYLEIIVVNDGSTDRTSAVVWEQFSNDVRVRLFAKENGGKAEALNFGLHEARGDVIVALDADTIFERETIGLLARRFYDPQIGAVAGNAKVGNRINIITRWQALEYITSQNLDRRAFASLNCITVVPGAVGAWRRDLVERAGGFTSDTLAEDQDLTLKVRRMGYKIGYEDRAVAWTEAPDTVRTLAKQRFRWSFGTLQCMWKHRDALFRRRYGSLGFIAMPNVWIFQILFPMISPLVDLMLLWSLASFLLERLEHPAEYVITNLKQVIFYYALFLAIDWITSAYAFILERRERWRLLWWLFLQRFFYRQIMYYAMIKSVLTAARGPLVVWGKLERKATVEMKP